MTYLELNKELKSLKEKFKSGDFSVYEKIKKLDAEIKQMDRAVLRTTK